MILLKGNVKRIPTALGPCRSQIRGEDLSPLLQLKDLMHIHQLALHELCVG